MDERIVRGRAPVGSKSRPDAAIPGDHVDGIARASTGAMRLASALVYLLFSWATAHMVTTLLIDRSEREAVDASAASELSR